MLATKVEEAKREEGFTLIELLVVVIIIGILAAIAIPVFLNQRESAYRSAVESDLRNAAVQVETVYTQDKSYPTGNGVNVTTVTELADVQISDNVTLTYTDPGNNSGGDGFLIVGDHTELSDSLTYDSAAGGLQGWP